MADGTLLFDRKREHFFLVPDVEALPEGADELVDLRGTPYPTDMAALAEHAIDKEQATAIGREQLGRAWAEARGALGKLLGFGQRAAEARGEPVSDEDAANPLPENLADILGVDPGAIHTDEEAAREAAMHVVEKLREMFGQRTDMAGAAQRMREKAAEIRDRRPPDLSEAGKKVEASLQSEEVEAALRKLGEGLTDLAKKFKERRDAAMAGEE